MDSCAHAGFGVNAIPLSRKWTSFSQTEYVSTPTRESGGAIQITSFVSKTLGYVVERFAGFAAYYPSSSNGNLSLCSMGSGGAVLCFLRIESDLSLSIYSGGNNQLCFNSGAQGFSITADVYHYYEFVVQLMGATPITFQASLRVDGKVIATTVAGSTNILSTQLLVQDTLMNQVTFSGPTGGASTGWITDIFIYDTNTTDFNGHATTIKAFQGDLGIAAVIPDQDAITQFTMQPVQTAHFKNVDEIPPDDDTTYNYSASVGQVETYLFTPIINFTGTIIAAQLCVYAKKDGEGTRAFRGQTGAQKDLTNLFGEDQYLYDYYDYYLFPLDTDAGTAWTPSGFNNESFGVKLTI